jgi:hypothetical protein
MRLVWLTSLAFVVACSRQVGALPDLGATRDAALVDGAGSLMDAALARDAAPAPDFAVAPDLAPSPDIALPCVSQFGAGLSAGFGRIDGTLVTVVKPTDLGCPHDDNHAILQVRMNGAVYPLWVNIGTDLDHMSMLEQTAALTAPAFAEGWHTDAQLDYSLTLGRTSTQFADTAPAGVVEELATKLTPGQPISVYTTGYGPDGGHDVHRHVTNQDGAVVISPTVAPRYLLFRFSNQVF